MDQQIIGILWGIMALILVLPWAWRLISSDPQQALRSVAGWLGLLVLLAWLYVYTGIGEWWEERQLPSPPSGIEATPTTRGQDI